ncbi:MAG: putative peptide modification system cyclase [Gammaproteobacteria bacterium]|uniref:putative peptide modification system cyclase n=1 Tax=Xanthomonas boreopolis TaxID=86183 RepID=UPI0032DCC1AB
MNDAHQPRLDAPKLRTLLLTDLCGSTELVEKLGDSAAAELFREHDHLVLKLQRQWRGRLIDRSDGMLLLFERPLEGLGFALDYARGLRELGKAHGIRLQARAGLHVGEVLTWRNSEEAVSIGAKPVEVEGLAKPMAARLMMLARPDQILLSAVAESLTRRAARELGERGERLLWKSHGRWRFKGVPMAQEVHEVGEIGIAPLRSPRNSPKAWRDVPLWRRPMALAAEVAAVAAICVVAWFATQPEPAIAFAERDWVVVADMRNLTGESVLDDSLEQAFRISLEQSRYVNVLSDLKIRQTLALMRRDPNASVLDRQLASEVALRDGARAVILPTVASVAGQTHFSIEVVDPHSQATVYVVNERNDGSDMLASLDRLSHGLREKLGEAMRDIDRSAPLPKVATSNFDALRAYALASKHYARRQFAEARQYFQQSINLDPGFALAYLGVMRTYLSTADNQAALPYLEKAKELRASLPPRDALYLDAWTAELEGQPWKEARAKWDMLAQMYPDYFAGPAQSAWLDFGNGYFASARRKTRQFDASQNPLRDIAFELRGRALLAEEKYGEARQAFLQAEQLGGYGPNRRHAAALAAAGDYPAALAMLDGLKLDESLTNGFEMMAIPFDAGRLDRARDAARKIYAATDDAPPILRYGLRVSALSILQASGSKEEVRPTLLPLVEEILQAAGTDRNGSRDDLAMMAMAAIRLAQRDGQRIPSRAFALVERLADESASPPLSNMLAVLQAEQLRLQGKPGEAVELLEEAGSKGNPDFLQRHVAMRDALRDQGRMEEAAKENRWLGGRRGLAYMEPYGALVLQGMNVSDVALARSQGMGLAGSPEPPPGRAVAAAR